MNRLVIAALSLGVLAACSDTAPILAPEAAPSLVRTPESGNGVPGQYIVVLRENGANPGMMTAQLAQAHGASVRFTYQSALRGFSARMSPAAAEAMARNPNVAFVEQDQEVTLSATQTITDGGLWGLDRIDAASGLNNSYTYAHTGAGQTVYIIDTGILLGHARRLQRPRHARRRHRRRHDLGRGQGVRAPSGARPRLQRQRHDLRRHRRRRLGDGEPRQAGGRQHEPRRRRFVLDTRHRHQQPRSTPASATVAAGNGGPAAGRLQLLAGAGGRAITVGATTSSDAKLVVLQLRQLRRLFAPGSEHHLGLVPSHTTGHAGPHPAVRKVEVSAVPASEVPVLASTSSGIAVFIAPCPAILHQLRREPPPPE
jgi:hypothetical protein